MVLCWTEVKTQRMVRKENGQDEEEQQRPAVQTISDPGQGDGGVLEALGSFVRAVRETK